MNNNLLFFIATHPLFLRRTFIVTATRDRSTIIESICFADTLVLAFTLLGAFLAGVIVSVAVGVIYWKRFNLLLKILRKHTMQEIHFKVRLRSYKFCFI